MPYLVNTTLAEKSSSGPPKTPLKLRLLMNPVSGDDSKNWLNPLLFKNEVMTRSNTRKVVKVARQIEQVSNKTRAKRVRFMQIGYSC